MTQRSHWLIIFILLLAALALVMFQSRAQAEETVPVHADAHVNLKLEGQTRILDIQIVGISVVKYYPVGSPSTKYIEYAGIGNRYRYLSVKIKDCVGGLEISLFQTPGRDPRQRTSLFQPSGICVSNSDLRRAAGFSVRPFVVYSDIWPNALRVHGDCTADDMTGTARANAIAAEYNPVGCKLTLSYLVESDNMLWLYSTDTPTCKFRVQSIEPTGYRLARIQFSSVADGCRRAELSTGETGMPVYILKD